MLLRKGNGWVFYLLWIFAITVSFAVACENEPSVDCPHKNKSVTEGESVEESLSETVEDLCIWNNATFEWDSACHFSHEVCQHLLPYFREDVFTEGNKFTLKHASQNASGLYRLLNNSGKCMLSMQISVLSARPTTSSPTTTTSSSQPGTFDIRFTKWSGVMRLCFLATIPILAMFGYL